MVAGKMRNDNGLSSLLFGIYHFLCIVILQNPFNYPVYSLWIMDISIAVAKYKSSHTVNHCTVEARFFLHLVLRFERFINRIHHRNRSNACLRFGKRYRKL